MKAAYRLAVGAGLTAILLAVGCSDDDSDETVAISRELLAGNWLVTNVSEYEREIAGAANSTFDTSYAVSDTSELYTITADSISYLWWDRANGDQCFDNSWAGPYWIEGSNIVGEWWDVRDSGEGCVYRYTTTAQFSGARIVITATETLNCPAESYSYTWRYIETCARFSGTVPPGNWPSLVCPPITVYKQIAKHRPGERRK